ncbi:MULTISPECIES: alpha/beta fold hydrolase [Rhizobium]|uniref:Soluble epoxide hydrolase SEH n=1 Tax=Rhizobium favelukesii TaxID=348824 RepID=W6RD20_9HYPH|nr:MULTISPECIES: alpha/beta hydrolase [Rhizobium]MCA0800718.1 alpha/beta hydrolase [Rhizobium sp. T1473]MCS0463417.1 alpha/beta hydrolase [Rhizobium favelukesii]UFS81778.1 alpha/beta hydrolase [Rhizobium sp. T136]CDM56568.1 Soluble epoxide hydrolase SEH [Rhizobium favelukesii]
MLTTLGVSPLPSGIPGEAVNLKLWQFGFNRLHDLPEVLVQGHERAYLTWLFQTKSTRNYAIDPAAVDELSGCSLLPARPAPGSNGTAPLSVPKGSLRRKSARKLRLTMPVLALGGGDRLGDGLRAAVAKIGDHVEGVATPGSGHFLPEEAPDEFTTAVLAFWQKNP